jgi:hypothetical protein
MNWAGRLYRSSIGAKLIMALTGILLFGFLIAHLLGNLQVFGGAEKINHYGQALRDLGALLWVARIGLLVIAVVHVATALRIVQANQAARPVAYVKQANRQIKPQTRLMWTSGLVLLGYALFHLAHFTWGYVLHDYWKAEATLADGRRVPRRLLDDGQRLPRLVGRGRLPRGDALPRVCTSATRSRASSRRSASTTQSTSAALALLGPAIATLFFVGYASIPGGDLGRLRDAAGRCAVMQGARSGPMNVANGADGNLDGRAPGGPLETKWERHKAELKLVNPANKRKFKVIVVGSGLAGASAAASLAELGYQVHCFCFQDSPRRAHSIAAQGGINAAKNYPNDGDSVWRLFYDTIKGGDFRAREANVHRLAEVSRNIIDQCVAQGVPVRARVRRAARQPSFGGAQVSRTFYARGQTGSSS